MDGRGPGLVGFLLDLLTAALDILAGSTLPESRLEFATQLPSIVPPEPFRWLGAQITMNALDTADAKGGWRLPWLKFVSALGFPLH